MYAVVEFDDGGLAVVNREWLTPRKGEVFWPPLKNSIKFNKQLKQPCQIIDEGTWKVYKLQRVFYETDDLEKANQKLKKAEVTSDLQTDVENSTSLPNKRHIKKRNFTSSDSEDDSETDIKRTSNMPNPPKLKWSGKSKEIFTPVMRLPTTSDSEDDQILERPQPVSTKEKMLESVKINVPDNSGLFSQSAPLSNTDTNRTRNSLPDQKFWSLLLEIKSQNSEILAILKDKGLGTNHPNENYTTKLPFELPLKSVEDVNNVEGFLLQKENSEMLTSYLSETGGKDVPTRTNRILKRLLDDGLATGYNFYGKRSNKRPFCSLKLRHCVVDAVKLQGQAAEFDVENFIKRWLKHAPERLKKRNPVQA